MKFLSEGIFRPDVLAEIDGETRLVGSRCSACGDVRFPTAPACPKCHAPAEDLVPAVLSRTGEVTAASRVERAIPPFKAPYYLAYVQLPEGPRIFCQLVTQARAASELIGRPCELVVEPVYEKEGKSVSS